jgi:1,4-dihydroxy-2-naphthoate polyprenyltransferase
MNVPHPNPVSSLQVWLNATRPATLLAGLVPVVVGSALAAKDGGFALGPALAALVGALLLQIGCNFANDLFDFINGADDEHRVGPARMTQTGMVTMRQMACATGLAMSGALFVGLYLVVVAGWPVVVIGLTGILAGIFYTAGPRPLGYLGLGEVLVFIFFGLAAVGGSYFVQTLTLTYEVMGIAASIGMLSSAILVVNNLRDRHTDVKVGKNTLAVRFGATFSRLEYFLLVLLAYVAPIAFGLHSGHLWSLLVLLSLPLGLLNARDVFQKDSEALNPLLGKTAKLEGLFGLLFSVGVLL